MSAPAAVVRVEPEPAKIVRFPAGFWWGMATSAAQIEGAWDLDGREPSIWDAFCEVPGRIADGSDARVACDHVRRYAADVDLLADLGCGTYRFSISWSRVMHADGTPNQRGIDFYARLVEALRNHGIRPWATLYHWDLPASVPAGWLDRGTSYGLGRFAALMAHALPEVDTWTTLNEPWCSAFLGYGSGEHAPGHTDAREAFTAAHHLLLGHGLAVQELRAAGAERVGLTLNFSPIGPATPADADIARRVDGTLNRFFVEPVFRGGYPDDVIVDAGADWPVMAIRPVDLAVIGEPIDVLGVNYYSPTIVTFGPGARSPHVTAPGARQVMQGFPVTAMGWEVEPAALTRLLCRLHHDYTGPRGVPLVVTENGAAYDDRIVAGGQIADLDRIAYLRDHLVACHDAMAAGVDLRGYLAWSYVDNFEWAYGYTKRFGLVGLDDDLSRRPKASAEWYAQVMRTGVVQ